MKLLIVTQAIDHDDPILGFFHAWVAKLAQHFEHIEVICLKKGRYDLPRNVYVHSLGKEQFTMIYHSTLMRWLLYLVRFGWLIWKLRSRYDRVLVHMNPEYVILGGLDWLLMGKRVALWYNHPKKDWRFRLATWLSHVVFYTSPYSAGASLKKAVRMPAGIDTELFKPQPVDRNRHALYMQGRITPSKHVEVALAALRIVRQTIPATMTLVGPEEATYGARLREEFADLVASKAVVFAGPKPNAETPVLYSAHGILINLASDGHYDKSVLESMACETPVILSSKAFVGLVRPEWTVEERNPSALAEAIVRMLVLSPVVYASLGKEERVAVVKNESLETLVHRLTERLAV